MVSRCPPRRRTSAAGHARRTTAAPAARSSSCHCHPLTFAFVGRLRILGRHPFRLHAARIPSYRAVAEYSFLFVGSQIDQLCPEKQSKCIS